MAWLWLWYHLGMATATTTNHPASLAAAEARNRNAGFHFFDGEALRFFGSRVLPTFHPGGFFVTSEWTGFDHAGRAWTVRQAMPDGQIETVGEFLAHETAQDARHAAREASRFHLARACDAIG